MRFHAKPFESHKNSNLESRAEIRSGTRIANNSGWAVHSRNGALLQIQKRLDVGQRFAYLQYEILTFVLISHSFYSKIIPEGIIF